MANACSRRDTGKARIGEQRDVLAVRNIFERAGHLIRFFHPGSERTDSGEHHHISRFDLPCFNRGHGVFFADENPRRSFFAINTIGINDRWVDGGRLHNGSFRSEVSAREGEGAGEPPGFSAFGRKYNFIGIDAVLLLQNFAEARAALRRFPFVQVFLERAAGDREYPCIQ